MARKKTKKGVAAKPAKKVNTKIATVDNSKNEPLTAAARKREKRN